MTKDYWVDTPKKPHPSTSRQKLRDKVRLMQVLTLAELGTCPRRKVATIFVDSKNRILAEGYNGSPPGARHCVDSPCPGSTCPSGSGLDLCEAIHAEQNALKECPRPDDVDTIYCTDSPCITCVKQLMGTGARRLVFIRAYPHNNARSTWEASGRKWEQVPESLLFEE